MTKTTADLLAETLTHAGVKRIYGVGGDSLNGLSDSLRRHKTIDWIHVRHEEGAAFAAGGEAHLTGELAVCAGSCGPGNLHLINGLFDCQRNGVPVLAIAAHIPSSEIGIDYSGDDCLIQYRGKSSRHSRGQALTEFASDRRTGPDRVNGLTRRLRLALE